MPRHRRDILLPPSLDGSQVRLPADTRRVIVIGGNGAGKSRFMEKTARLNPDRACELTAISAVYPDRKKPEITGSLEDLFYHAIASRSGLDGSSSKLLTKICHIWEEFFPGNRISLTEDSLLFATQAGDDLVGLDCLSQGEKTVLYFSAAVLYAKPGTLFFIDSPSLFLHPSIVGPFWNAIERLRPDCVFFYNSVDVDFISSAHSGICLWIRRYDSATRSWDYSPIPDNSLPEDILVEMAGSRRPVLFVEGDSRHSIDVRLYSMVFPDWTIRPLGSCNKVIETTRTFNDLKTMHQLRSRGIVDRDRRSDMEVEYLRQKEIMVPEVAEIENIFMLPAVILSMARIRGKNPDKILAKVRREVMGMFRHEADRQALQHVRHRVKREVECKIDAKFTCITALETHLKTLVYKLRPRDHYNQLRRQFARLLETGDYEGVLKVFNHKPMVPNSGIHQLLGFRTKEDYIAGVIDTLRIPGPDSDRIRNAIRHCFRLENENHGSPAL